MGSRKWMVAVLMAALVAVPVFAGGADEETVPERSVVFQNTGADPTAPERTLSDDVIGFLEGPLSFSGRDHELNTQLALQMQTDDEGDVASVASSSVGGEKINPGRAILMSALIPGAGQFYAGSNMDDPTITYIKSAVFFAAEIGFWTGAILYAKKGQDKEDEYEQFADNRWNEDVYLGYEYWLAKQPGMGQSDEPYSGEDINAWKNLSWEERIRYLPANFTHELPPSKDQQYYEMIGKYLTQFGIGWEDVYTRYPNELPSDNDYQDYYANDRWSELGSSLASNYADMRYDSNKLLDKSSAFFMAIMVNHVVSAVDAAFTVRLHNNRVVRGEVASDTRIFNGEPVVMGGVNLTF